MKGTDRAILREEPCSILLCVSCSHTPCCCTSTDLGHGYTYYVKNPVQYYFVYHVRIHLIAVLVQILDMVGYWQKLLSHLLLDGDG